MRAFCSGLLALFLLPCHVSAELELSSLFSHNMVLQRDAAVAIWGQTDSGETATVSFAGQNVSAKANAQGKWRAVLKPLAASAAPRSLVVQAGEGKVTISNVLVGDVWVGAGQGNMSGHIGLYAKKDTMLASVAGKAPYPGIRLMQGGPQPTWSEATGQSISEFSALHFSFGERLHRDLEVPIGLIVAAVGGTPSGSWIPPATYARSKKCKADVAAYRRTFDRAAAWRQYKAELAAWEERVAAAKAKGEKPKERKPVRSEPGESSRGDKIGGLYEQFIKPVVGYRISTLR